MTEGRKGKDKTIYMRMVFSGIQHDNFEWDWQSSEDKVTWKSVWTIHYKRADS